MRTIRTNTIISIINENRISSQEELLSLLKEQGIITTQATLSRDLKALKVAKQPDHEGGYIYVMPEITEEEVDLSLNEFPLSGFISIDFSGNMAVVKTRPGFANGLASVIDSYDPDEILGTIAGDDTILIIIREGVERIELLESLAQILPKIKDRNK